MTDRTFYRSVTGVVFSLPADVVFERPQLFRQMSDEEVRLHLESLVVQELSTPPEPPKVGRPKASAKKKIIPSLRKKSKVRVVKAEPKLVEPEPEAESESDPVARLLELRQQKREVKHGDL